MSGRDEIMRPGFLGFPSFAQGFGLLLGRLFLRPGSFRKPTKWDFASAVTQGWAITYRPDSPMMRKILSYRFYVKCKK